MVMLHALENKLFKDISRNDQLTLKIQIKSCIFLILTPNVDKITCKDVVLVCVSKPCHTAYTDTTAKTWWKSVFHIHLATFVVNCMRSSFAPFFIMDRKSYKPRTFTVYRDRRYRYAISKKTSCFISYLAKTLSKITYQDLFQQNTVVTYMIDKLVIRFSTLHFLIDYSTPRGSRKWQIIYVFPTFVCIQFYTCLLVLK